jgi:Ran-binding protein 1
VKIEDRGFSWSFPKMSSETKPESPQEDHEPVDDSHKEAPSTAAEQKDPDENEDKLFGDKALLYRFDKASSDWKERGSGFMKILKSKENGRCRILMRRFQTFRVCANHFILPYMELKPHSGSERAFIWQATDFADGQESRDVLSVKFKNAEIAQEFKKAFEQAKQVNKTILDAQETGKTAAPPAPLAEPTASPEQAQPAAEKKPESADEVKPTTGDEDKKE